MESLIQNEGEVHSPSKLSQQALWFGIHTCLALGSWLLLMFVGYALQPSGISQLIITVLSLAVPLLVGFFVTRSRQDEMASVVWLAGLIWMLIANLWILDMPAGPNQIRLPNAMRQRSFRGRSSVFPAPAA